MQNQPAVKFDQQEDEKVKAPIVEKKDRVTVMTPLLSMRNLNLVSLLLSTQL
jgi:hypothetical protein